MVSGCICLGPDHTPCVTLGGSARKRGFKIITKLLNIASLMLMLTYHNFLSTTTFSEFLDFLVPIQILRQNEAAKMSITVETDIFIVGAGPAGGSMASFLA